MARGQEENPLALTGKKEYLRFAARTGTPDSNGERSWQKVYACMGVVATQGSREVFQARQFSGQATHVLSIAYPLGVTIAPGMRVQFAGGYLAVQDPPEDVLRAKRKLKITCLEIDAAGATA